jgi:hypothetical protein
MRPGRSRNLAGDTPTGERGRPGGHHFQAAPRLGRRFYRQSDGLFQLHEHLDRGTLGAVCLNESFKLAR